jgi:hypothetical protein
MMMNSEVNLPHKFVINQPELRVEETSVAMLFKSQNATFD